MTEYLKINNLHSNMVRFIIRACCKSSGIYPLIYIPIWLDLLFLLASHIDNMVSNLHSNMVRFIMRKGVNVK